MGEWENLPWWQQRLYYEGLLEDESVPVESAGTPRTSTGAQAIGRVGDPFAPLDEMAARGFSVSTIGD